MYAQQSKIIYEKIARIDIRMRPKEYSREVLGVICTHLDYSFASIILVDERGYGHMFAGYDLPDNYMKGVQAAKVPILQSPSGIAIETGQIVASNRLMEEQRVAPWRGLIQHYHIDSIVWVPLVGKGKAFGTYVLYDTRKRELEEHEREILYQLSVLFSLAIISNEYIDEIQEKNVALKNEIRERIKIEKDLREAKERAEAADRAKSEFLANMSHEIRTPMNAILGFSDLLLHDEADPEKMEILSLIETSGKKLMNLIDALLELSAIGTNSVNLAKDEFSIREILEGMADKFVDIIKERDIGFCLNVDDSVPPLLLGDRERVEAIITHIVDNAFKFTEKGSVTIDCKYIQSQEWQCPRSKEKEGIEELGKGMLKIDITDSGIGISKDKQEVIFSMFTQVDSSTTRKYGGMGMGLAIAVRLAEMMCGRIRLSSTEGVGSTFTIELALKEAVE